jgi:hypothetical protein
MSKSQKRDEKTWVKGLTKTASYRIRRKRLRKEILPTTYSKSRYSNYGILVVAITDQRHGRVSGGYHRPPRNVRDCMIPTDQQACSKEEVDAEASAF